MAYTFKMRGVTFTAESLSGISAVYSLARDASGEGNSTFPKPTIRNGKSIIGIFSYNGRIWSNDGAANQVLIYDNRADAEMSRPTTYQRVEVTNDPSGDTWLIREEYNNLAKAKAFFNRMKAGRRYLRVSLEMYDKNGVHLGTNCWMRGDKCAS